MKVYYIGVIRKDPNPVRELCCACDVSSFGYFHRPYVQQFMTMFSCTVVEYAKVLGQHETREELLMFYSYVRPEGVAAVTITDQEYPKRVAQKLLMQVADEFLTLHTRAKWAGEGGKLVMPQLSEYLVKFQDPQQADSLLRIQQELDETKVTLHKTMQSMLERGDKIDDLVARSEGLSTASKMFYTQAKKQNSCCAIT